MLEAMVGLKKLTIHQCQKLAQDVGFDRATFDLCGPKGRLPCRWLDAYFGMFIIGENEGFNMVSEFEFIPDVWCENLMPGEKERSAAHRSSTEDQ